MTLNSSLAEKIYALLLRLYPSTYLDDYRQPMRQAFRDQWRSAPSPLTLAVAIAVDLARSLPRVHWTERMNTMKSLKIHTLLLFVVMIAFLGRYELRTDDAGMVLLFTLTFAFVLAYLNPAWAKLWAFVGLCVPFVHLVVRPGQMRFEPHTPPPSWGSLFAIFLIVLALGAAGSYAGTKLRRALHPPAAVC